VVEPGQPFNVSEFKWLTLAAIADISGRGKLPIMVGGTGLYVDSVIFDYSFREPADPHKRAELTQLSVEEMQARLREQGIPLPENERNPRHLLRVLESGGQLNERKPLRENTLVLGLKLDRAELEARITKRVDAMFADGFIDEARQLGERYGWDTEALQVPGYTEAREYLDGSLSLDAAKQATARAHLQLAKRQRTWFKRNKSIHYIREQAEAVDLVTSLLNT
jgi:tRNA dimethylallyltransferase